MSELKIDFHLNMWQKMLSNAIQLVESLFYQQVDDLEQFLGTKNITSPGFEFRDLMLIKNWIAGNKSSEEVANTFAKMDLQDTAYNVLVKELDKFWQQDKFDEETQNKLKDTVVTLMRDVVPKYEDYLKKFYKYIVKHHDTNMKYPPIVYCIETNAVFVTKEMYLDQAIRMIKAHQLEITSGKVMNDHVVTFQKALPKYDNYRKDIILCSKKDQIEVLRKVFHINNLVIIGSDKMFIENLEQKIIEASHA